MIDDFNENLIQKEKVGDCPRGEALMGRFRAALEDLRLNDLEHK